MDSGVLGGKPIIRGTRLAVEFILELLAAGQSESQSHAKFPNLINNLTQIPQVPPVPM